MPTLTCGLPNVSRKMSFRDMNLRETSVIFSGNEMTSRKKENQPANNNASLKILFLSETFSIISNLCVFSHIA